MTEQLEHAKTFATLHRAGSPLLLPNAWDAASAVVITGAGAAAIATTSAGVAWSLGVPDGADLGADRNAEVIARIVAAVDVPVSADIEAGYGESPETVAATVTAVVQAGAVGVNIEDRIGPKLLEPAAQAERLIAAREAAERLGVPVWINARTDIYLAGIGEPRTWPGLTEERASVYAAAGVDSVFVPGLVDTAVVGKLSEGPAPIAVMAWPGAPTVSEFAKAGVVRISLGSGIAQAAYAVAARATKELLTSGTYDATAAALSFGELDSAIAAGHRS
ncbi:MAG TPA: isocitrate lyase/phosphoenolpyruvate mutase family protein [Pseudonocardiaceae bacterium]|jgi:2-methylisocitrate lyase-like PEP mutase family enzyme|nr:isocitrate lyase/phosphoenolpyruvate mutase family protein [Pseudonocardiaceae bacterium]